MNATIIREARAFTPASSENQSEHARVAILQIDGIQWTSPIPGNSGEAQTFNEDAQRICERVK